ncbi:putative reverse transcriptase domain-containing protein [Tanacetum coccineum]
MLATRGSGKVTTMEARANKTKSIRYLVHAINIDLMPIELGSSDVIIGMDWLSMYHAMIVCADKIVRIPWGEETLIVHAHITTKEAEDKSEKKRLEDVPIVVNFPEYNLSISSFSELKELSEQLPKNLSQMLYKTQFSPWGDPSLLSKKKDGHERTGSIYGHESVWQTILDKFVIVFIDDVLIYSKNKKEHEEHLKAILEMLKKEELYAKFSKCEFWIPKVQFLGHVINSQGIHVDPTKIESIKDGASPKTPIKIRQFLGLAGYYRRFIEGFLKIAKPMTKLTQKKVAFAWGDKQETAFQKLKNKLCSTPILALPQGAVNLIVYCDASHKGLGTVLMQNKKVITYASRQSKIHEKNYTTHDLELGAVMFALKLWRYYLYRTKCTVFTDHKSLQDILDQKELNMRQRRWLELLSDYGREIHYHLGRSRLNTKDHRDCWYNPRYLNGSGIISLWILSQSFLSRHKYHASIKTAPFEALYGRKCRSPVCWAEVGQVQLTGLEIVQEATEKVIQIKQRMQAARDRQKSYFNLKRKPMEFQVGDRVMLKISPWKGVVHFGKRGKLNLRYVGLFKVLEKVRSVAYKLELPQELSRVHNTFHVSNLKKCCSDEPLAIPLEGLHVDDKLCFVEEPIEIIDREVKRLKQSRILIVKVRWNSRRGHEFSWEREEQLQKKYPHLFTKPVPSSSVLT